MNRKTAVGLLILACAPAVAWRTGAQPAADAGTRVLAAKPPMGWNSWDGYGTTLNEEQFKANVKSIFPGRNLVCPVANIRCDRYGSRRARAEPQAWQRKYRPAPVCS